MKLLIDILMFILMLLEYSRNYLPTILHEIIGIILLLLVIIHLILNKKYIKNIPNGKYNSKRILMLTINILFILAFSLTIVTGLLTSEDLLVFLNIGNYKITSLHKISSYIALIVLGLHIGINFNSMFYKLEKHINSKYLIIIKVLIIVYGIYSIYKLNIISKLLGHTLFMKDSNIFVNILRYISTILMISIIVDLISKRSINENRKKLNKSKKQ